MKILWNSTTSFNLPGLDRIGVIISSEKNAQHAVAAMFGITGLNIARLVKSRVPAATGGSKLGKVW